MTMMYSPAVHKRRESATQFTQNRLKVLVGGPFGKDFFTQICELFFLCLVRFVQIFSNASMLGMLFPVILWNSDKILFCI